MAFCGGGVCSGVPSLIAPRTVMASCDVVETGQWRYVSSSPPPVSKFDFPSPLPASDNVIGELRDLQTINFGLCFEGEREDDCALYQRLKFLQRMVDSAVLRRKKTSG